MDEPSFVENLMKVRLKPLETDAITVRDIINQAHPGNHPPLPDWVQRAIDEGKIIIRRHDIIVRTPIGPQEGYFTDVLLRDHTTHGNESVFVLPEAIFEKTYLIVAEEPGIIPCAIPT